ncbi:acetyl-CoA carboxylase biotin carboxylase subunit [Sneathiella chungangensis]|uniref:Acetyl-CoA carboxylase biotin carboxylase subunit n=1 Tax=Sneathiella chungangensis TaxID=1418234 RepID=A0A845MBQ2_9PROT|nr:biotin carboxylase N-terminal domain-containing protein [Sneathiella chungangensis]MZR21162.1 acetyl-CoA carboxylase biotin carboxylase subunit [Sneathiella chungangensis]
MKTVEKLLIANRGEIACRIIRTCKKMGIKTVSVYSEADREALHVRIADEAYEIGPPPVNESYLDVRAILRVMQESGANAVHPGYGLLAENAAFARAVQEAGHLWIGPDPATIDAMGDKERARALAISLGVPVAPGSGRFQPSDDVDKKDIADKIGYPLLIKAAAGGGGIGMRAVSSAEELDAQIETTQKLAGRIFGDPSVFLERYVANARHVEVQIFGFGNGEGIHLFDRDCTIQRRFQKIIEEAPAPALPKDIRIRMQEAALILVRHQSYLGAGTVEFIYDCDRKDFYFLEMNTRIQVEHAVTEMVTGIDLVRWQIEAATGAFTAARQEDFDLTGHALECRIYAERPEKNFMPSPGTLTCLQFPEQTDDLRIDTGVEQGDKITPYYDPMIAKIVASGPDRAAAISRMRTALSQTKIEGPGCNLAFLLMVLTDPDFEKVDITTNYIERRHRQKKIA